MPQILLNHEDESRLRDLASGLAKEIEDPREIIKRLGFSLEEFQELAETRIFKQILDQAIQEWQGANNTPKRIKLKAAVNIEQALPSFYNAMVSPNEPLSSRVKAFEVVARIGGLGNPEPAMGSGGPTFHLEIHLSGKKDMITIESESVKQSSLLRDRAMEEL